MSDEPDARSLQQLKDTVNEVPPQKGERAAKALADLKAAVEPMERKAKRK